MDDVVFEALLRFQRVCGLGKAAEGVVGVHDANFGRGACIFGEAAQDGGGKRAGKAVRIPATGVNTLDTCKLSDKTRARLCALSICLLPCCCVFDSCAQTGQHSA